MLTHHTNREMKLAQVLTICTILAFPTVGAINADEKSPLPAETHHITELAAVIGACPEGPNWKKFGYDEKSSITFCMNRFPGPPSTATPRSLDDLTYTITQIRGYAATGFTCQSQFGIGWTQWGWDGQSHIHFCEQLGNGKEPTYLTSIGTQLGKGCSNFGKDWDLSIYNKNSNISFCVQSAVRY